MQRQQFAKHWNRFIQRAVRYWLDLSGEDVSESRRQLERMVDCVCDLHGVARNTAEQEIYNGLMRLTAVKASAGANLRGENANF